MAKAKKPVLKNGKELEVWFDNQIKEISFSRESLRENSGLSQEQAVRLEYLKILKIICSELDWNVNMERSGSRILVKVKAESSGLVLLYGTYLRGVPKMFRAYSAGKAHEMNPINALLINIDVKQIMKDPLALFVENNDIRKKLLSDMSFTSPWKTTRKVIRAPDEETKLMGHFLDRTALNCAEIEK